MGIITKEVEIKPSRKNIQYYRDLGYDAKYDTLLKVNVKDLPKYSHVKIDVLCDYCGDIKSITFDHYNRCKRSNNLYACTHCITNKVSETCLRQYGVANYAMLPEIQEKMRDAVMQHFGVRNVMQNKDFKHHFDEMIYQKYGVENISQLPEIKEKVARTMYQNGTQKSSKQQRYINLLYGGILNYKVSYYNVDIYLPDDNLTIEYDGGFHLGNVITGRETQEEFNQKEIIRNNIIKREGYKQMRIISDNDKLPSDQVLLQMLQDARNYFSDYPNHSWIEFNIDTSTVRNAEHKDGIPYNFGTLRRIKDEDLTNQTNNLTKGA